MGQCWSAKGGLTTVVQVGRQPADDHGRRPDDRLVGVMETPELARRVVAAVNQPWVCRACGGPLIACTECGRPAQCGEDACVEHTQGDPR